MDLNGGGMSQISLAAAIVQGNKNFGLRERIMAISTSGSNDYEWQSYLGV